MSSEPPKGRSERKFVADVLRSDFPPAIPLRQPHWAGLAFDRNRHPDLAPAEVWDALLHEHAAAGREVAVMSSNDLDSGRSPALLRADRAALMSHLGQDFRFASDHYVLSPGQNWICRLDQDVTLIAGEAQFMRQVVARCGGLEAIMKVMMHDFDPGPTDSAGLKQYLMSLTRGIREG